MLCMKLVALLVRTRWSGPVAAFSGSPGTKRSVEPEALSAIVGVPGTGGGGEAGGTPPGAGAPGAGAPTWAAAQRSPAARISAMARRIEAFLRFRTFGGAFAAPLSAAARRRRAGVAFGAPASQAPAGASRRKRAFSPASGDRGAV